MILLFLRQAAQFGTLKESHVIPCSHGISYKGDRAISMGACSRASDISIITAMHRSSKSCQPDTASAALWKIDKN